MQQNNQNDMGAQQRPKIQISLHSHADSTNQNIHYRNDPKFLDRWVWANSVDPDQTSPVPNPNPNPRGAVWSESTLFAIPSQFSFLGFLW